MRVSFPDVAIVIGSVLLFAGIAAYDWRLSLIVCGALLLCGGIAGMVRGK